MVLRDRKHLASDGIVVVILPMEKNTSKIAGAVEVVSRGFVDMDEREELIDRTRDHVTKKLEERRPHAGVGGGAHRGEGDGREVPVR